MPLIADILDDPARAARLSAQARSYALGWASSHMAWRLAELYRELTLQHAPAAVVAA